jgi:hypothetical protein
LPSGIRPGQTQTNCAREGNTGPVPDGHFVYRSGTNNVFVFLRSFYQDPNNLKPTVDVMEATKIYPLGGQASARSMQFPDASGVPANMIPVSDAGAFVQLKALVDSEGPQLADPDWRGMLAAIGIVQGQPFNPDAAVRAILDCAARTAYKMSRVIGTQETVAVARSSSIPTAVGSTQLPTGLHRTLAER